jgi:acetolactate synthase-1/2/3 large subunit
MTAINRSTAAKAVVEALKAENVSFVFGLAGSHVLPIFDALADQPHIHHIVVKHENNAAFMAGMCGYLTGRPGVALVTAGPGATNSLSGVAQAYASSLPMVHISGDVPLAAGNEAFHGVDRPDFLHEMFADITKWSVRVEGAEDIPRILSRAFSLAASGRPGPVHVDIPVDIVRATDLDVPPYQASPVEKLAPPEELVPRVRQALAAAQRPMICAGRGVLAHRAEAELIALAEAVSAPVFCSSYGLGAIPEDHPLALGSFSEWRQNAFVWDMLAQSDFLLAVGLRSNTRMTRLLAQHAPEQYIFVALDEPHTLHAVEGATTTVACDSRLFLSQLLTYADDLRRAVDPSPRARIAQHRQAFQSGLATYMAPFADVQPLHFGRVVQELAARLDKEGIVVSGVGNHNVWGQIMLPIHNRESYIQEGSWGTMGGELAGGIAAKLVYPQRQVVVLTGDGSLLMGASDFVTTVEAGVNVLVVVLNDSRYGMITAMQRRRFGRSFGDQIGTIDFAQFASSFGAAGVRVESPEALPDAVARALALSAETPVILDAVCNYEYRWPDREAILALSAEEGAPDE